MLPDTDVDSTVSTLLVFNSVWRCITPEDAKIQTHIFYWKSNSREKMIREISSWGEARIYTSYTVFFFFFLNKQIQSFKYDTKNSNEYSFHVGAW